MSDFNYQQIDDIIHSRIRLAIMAILVSVDQAEFKFFNPTLPHYPANPNKNNR